MARSTAAVERLNWSTGVSAAVISGAPGPDTRLLQLRAEAALIILGHGRALDLVAFVEEGQAEGEGDVAAEDPDILGPGDPRARPHAGPDIPIDEAGARQIGQRHHGGDRLAALVIVEARHLGQDDRDLGLMR